MISVAIAAARKEVRAGLAASLGAEPGIALGAEAADGPGLSRLFAAGGVDLVLAEWALLAGFSPPALRGARPLVLAFGCDAETAIEAFAAGARAVVPAGAPAAELVAAVRAAACGLAVVPAPLLATLFDAEPGDPAPVLTGREQEVLAAMADGLSNKMIARRLGISFHTAKFHVAAVLQKLGAESRTEAVAKAARQGLVML